MKSLFLVRHAKSSWDIGSLADFDRPLNDRGKKDAPRMASRLLKNITAIECFISSPAIRAKTTAQYFAEAFGRSKKDIELIPKLYEPSVPAFYETVAAIDPACASAAIFSHNPGITEFVHSLEIISIDDMPTCSIFAFTIDTDQWSDFKKARKDLLFFKYPKSPDD